MSLASRKWHSNAPSTSTPARGSASSPASLVTQRVQGLNNSQSHLQSLRKNQQPQPVSPWSAHAPPFGQSPSPFLRESHALSMSATAAGELFLFGGYVHRSRSPSNDSYVISTRDFSATLLQTSGDIPSPRFGHRAVLTSTTLLIWGGMNFSNQKAQNPSIDGSLYLLNLTSREWTRIVVNGPGPVGRYNHTMTLVGLKLFIFGGRTTKVRLNDIWALDLNYLKSNPYWESYDPAPGSERPFPRAGHVSVTTGDRIIIYGGHCSPHYFNDTWSFNILTRKWTELQCAGSIAPPRAGHAAALVDDVMYVFGGFTGKTPLDDLIALQLSTRRWTAFRDIGPNPCGRGGHAMASDGRRVFVVGGELSPGTQVDEAKLIHVLDTRLLIYSKPDSNTLEHNEKTAQLTQKLSAGHPTQGEPQHRMSSSSDAGVAGGAFSFHNLPSQPVYPWSAHTSPSVQWPSPFPRRLHTLSAIPTATDELFLFGGNTNDRSCNDLYVISTRDFSITLLQTSGDIPSPRYGHCVVLTSTTLLIWGGSDLSNRNAQKQSNDESFYLLDLVSREWSRIVINGPGPVGRYYHTLTLIGSKLFVFGGKSDEWYLNDIWAFDLIYLQSNPFWESYEPVPGNQRPLPRAGHVSVTTGDRVIIFGGSGSRYNFNDTWSFNISTRKWTEIQCTGSIPSPRAGHAAVLIGDVMYVFGGLAPDGTKLGDLTAFNLSTKRWTAFLDTGPSPCGRSGHAMACDGGRVLVIGGALPLGTHVDEAKLIHVLDTKLLIYPKPSITVKHSEETTQLVQKVSAGHPIQGQPQQPTFSSSESGIHAEPGISPFQNATPGVLDHPTSLQTTWDRSPSLNDPPSLFPGTNNKPRRVPQDDDESSADHLAKLVAPDTPSENEVVSLEHERLIELERQLLAMRAAQTERDRRIAQLTDQLVRKSALLEQAEVNVAEAKKRAGLDQRELQAKVDELLLSRDRAEANAGEAKKRAGLVRLEQCELQSKLDELLLSRDQALVQAQSDTFDAVAANERSRRELAEVHAKLEATESELVGVRLRLMDAEDGWARSKALAEAATSRAGTQDAAGLVDKDVDRVMWRLMERVRVVEAEMASLRGNNKA